MSSIIARLALALTVTVLCLISFAAGFYFGYVEGREGWKADHKSFVMPRL